MNDILRSIHEADYIIADLTEQNPNVYYELGLAHATGKPIILITQNIGKLPFDLRHQRVIEYSDTAAGAAQLSTVLARYLSNI
jgi:nucleoside 2-deoxyribosyltransferase